MGELTAKQEDLLRRLGDALPFATLEADRGGLPSIRVSRERYLEVIHRLRDDAALGFTIFSHLCGAHYPHDAEPFEVVVHLTSLTLRAQVAVKVRAGGELPSVPSLATFWPAANWHEREAFDMFGIHFTGHPDLRRIFLEEDADFYPLRKEYPVEGTN
jgi:NADH-quinone oxidoreductase subunit C